MTAKDDACLSHFRLQSFVIFAAFFENQATFKFNCNRHNLSFVSFDRITFKGWAPKNEESKKSIKNWVFNLLRRGDYGTKNIFC